MTDAAGLKEEGNAKFKAQQYAAAVDAYTKSLELDATQHLCLSNRSAAYLKLGDSAELALADAQRCVELAPTFAKGYSRQAAALQELKRWEDAVKVCEQGMQVAPDEVLRKMLQEVRNRHVQDLMQGAWHGKVSEDLGGYDQEMEFMDSGKVRVGVLGRSIVGSYWLDCEKMPHHLSIQVPMPDAPPGMPPPPPVPYIVRLDDKGLHLCCPFMVMDRPTKFDGPGYVLMKRGALAGDNLAEELGRLPEDARMRMCARELATALPNTKLEEPKQTDSEEVTRDKLMAQVRFESSMFSVQKKFGEEMMKQVLSAVKGDDGVPECLAKTTELKHLREKFSACGLLEENASPSTAAPPQAAAPPPLAHPPTDQRAVPAPAKGPGDAGRAGGGDGASAISPALVVGLLVGAFAIAAAGALLWQRRRR